MEQRRANNITCIPLGTTLQGGRYRVEQYLSSGNFGNTYIVTNRAFGEKQAMKEFFLSGYCYRGNDGKHVNILPTANPNGVYEQREKFKKEAHRLRSLSNEHIVRVYDLFEENGTVYYVMDYVNGRSLASYMRQKAHPLTEQEVYAILNQLLDGLEIIHDKRIWHLDLKPDNIMIDQSGKVVIIDFGASKQIGHSGGYTGTTNRLCYTPGYAPLEQVNQNLHEIGPWTDIYALGATMFNLLTGMEPEIRPLKALPFPNGLSVKTKKLIIWMMDIDKTRRPQSINEIRNFLGIKQKISNKAAKKSQLALFSIITLSVLLFVSVIVNIVGIKGIETINLVQDDATMKEAVEQDRLFLESQIEVLLERNKELEDQNNKLLAENERSQDDKKQDEQNTKGATNKEAKQTAEAIIAQLDKMINFKFNVSKIRKDERIRRARGAKAKYRDEAIRLLTNLNTQTKNKFLDTIKQVREQLKDPNSGETPCMLTAPDSSGKLYVSSVAAKQALEEMKKTITDEIITSL